MSINPIKLYGEWDEGYALDRHTIRSVPIGDDAYGHMRFETTRSELGELLYNFKYGYQAVNLPRIMEIIIPFLNSWEKLKTVDVIMPVPPTNKYRPFQPAVEIARSISVYLNKNFVDDVLEKTTSEQSKDICTEQKRKLKGTIILKRKGIREFNILLVDDLYDSGTTLSECTHALRQDENIRNVYVLTITKTKG
jgi:competence protein ComFC